MTHLEVWNWQGLEHAVLENLSEHLNVITGPNESGKSRLFGAIHYALYEPSKGNRASQKRLKSWQEESGPPKVRLDFVDDAGKSYRLTKQYLAKSTTRLESGSSAWEQEEAETELQRIFTLESSKPVPKRYISTERLRRTSAMGSGIWPLLWLGQGDAAQIAPTTDLTASSRSQLQDLLGLEIDTVLGGALGSFVKERVDSQHARYWTPNTGVASAELKKAQDTHARTAAELEQIRTRYDNNRQRMEELLHTEQELERLATGLETRSNALRHAEEQQKEAEALQQQLHQDRQALTLCTEGLKNLRLQQDQHTTCRQRIADETARLKRLRTEQEALREQIDRQQRALQQQETAHQEQRTLQAQADAALTRHRNHDERQRLDHQHQELTRTLAEVAKREARIRDLKRRLDTLTVDEAVLERLESLHAALERDRGAQRDQAVKLHITPTRTLVIGDETLEPGQAHTILCSGPTRIEIDQVGTLAVEMHDDTLTELNRRILENQTALKALLTEHGLTTLRQGVEQVEQRRRITTDILHTETERSALAPKGTETLKAHLRALEKSLGTLHAATTDDDGAQRSNPLFKDADGVRRWLAEHEPKRQKIQENLRRDALLLSSLKEKVATLTGEITAAERECERLTVQQHSLPDPDALEKSLHERQEEHDILSATLRNHTTTLQSRGLDAAHKRFEREKSAYSTLRKQRDALQERRIALSAVLKESRNQGLFETLQDAQALHQQSRETLAVTQRKADAIACLKQHLETAGRAAQQQLRAPVLERVRPYITRLFTNAELDLGDDWQINGLTFGSRSAPFEMLSGGAREQFNILVRLALGRVLAGENRLPMLLDDALVNTDITRLHTLFDILYSESRTALQIIVFSSDPERFEAAGAERLFTLPPGRSRI
ncbi:MAG: hypothetical protein HQL50_07090 [Magnetococcales bacterium]|nr:hypothetical protein [Magnetococcales bacterium]